MITSEKIRTLREKTGAGMMDCKNALLEVKGDLESAVDWLRKKGVNTAAKKSVREATDGLITISENDTQMSILEVNSETDFVARNNNFQQFCLNLSKTILSNQFESVNDILDSIFYQSDKKVSEELTNLISKLGENIKIKRFDILSKSSNEFLSSYIHNAVNPNSGKIGVILKAKSTENFPDLDIFLKNISMHIAATEPKSISPDDLKEEIVNREKSIYIEQLEKSDKPKDIQEKILIGKVKKFYQEVCLLNQSFVMDNQLSIQQYIHDQMKKYDCVINIQSFLFYRVGDTVQ